MLVTIVGLLTLIVFSIILSHILTVKQEEKASIVAEDLAESLKQEISFASNAEKGYSRIVSLPKQIEGRSYDVTLGSTNINTSYFEIEIDNAIFFEIIPLTNGAIEPGIIKISKRTNNVFVEVIS